MAISVTTAVAVIVSGWLLFSAPKIVTLAKTAAKFLPERESVTSIRFNRCVTIHHRSLGIASPQHSAKPFQCTASALY